MSKRPQRERISSSLIAALRQRRETLGISMNLLAQKSGLSLTMISFVEREMRKPTLDTLLRIAEALDVELGVMIQRATKVAKRSSKS